MKRIISLIMSFLIFAVLLPLPSSADTVIAASDELYENSKALVSAINKSFAVDKMSPDDRISRADFIRLALGVYDMGFLSSKHTYVDLPEDINSYISYAIDTGMIDSGINFYPDSPIDFDMAVRIAVVMTGYTPYALSGGYIVAADRAGLLKGVGTGDFKVRDAVVLMANVLDAPVMIQSIYGTASQKYTISDESFLQMYRGISHTEGIVNANMYTSLTSANGACSDNRIIVGTDEYRCDDSSYLGYNVRAYYEEETKKIVALYGVDNNVVSSDEVVSLNGNNLTYYNSSGDEKRINLSETYQFIYNGKAYMYSDFEGLFHFDEGFADFVDNNNDKKYDVVFVWEYNYIRASNIDLYNERIFDVNNDAVIDMYDDKCRYEIFYKYALVTQKKELHDIPDDAAITYCLSKDGLYCRMYITEDSISGRFSEVNTQYKYAKIGDSYYNYSSYFEKYYMHYFGQTATFYISIDGKLHSAGPILDESTKYGWLAKCSFVKNGINESLHLRIYTQDGKLTDYTTKPEFILNGTPGTDHELAYTDCLKSYSEGDAYDRVIKYTLGDDGFISLIDTAEAASRAVDMSNAKDPQNSLMKCYNESLRYRKSPATFGAMFRMSSSTVVFTVPEDELSRGDEKNFSVSTHDKVFADDKNYEVAAYDVDKSGLSGCVVYIAAASSSANADRADSALFDCARTVYFPDEGEIKKVYDLVMNGEHLSLTAYNADVEEVMDTASPGDVLRISINARDEITGAILDYDLSARNFVSAVSSKIIVEYFDGYADGYTNGYMNVVTDKSAQSIDDVLIADYKHICTSRGTEVFATVILDKNNVIKDIIPNNMDNSSLLNFTDVGTGADLVMVRRRYAAPDLTVVYRFVTKQ